MIYAVLGNGLSLLQVLHFLQQPIKFGTVVSPFHKETNMQTVKVTDQVRTADQWQNWKQSRLLMPTSIVSPENVTPTSQLLAEVLNY